MGTLYDFQAKTAARATFGGGVSGGAGSGASFGSTVQPRSAPQLCQTQLRRGDSLQSLATEYGVTPQQIVEWNGLPWDGKAINSWVLSSGGVRLPYDAKKPNPYEAGQGWPVFSDESVIMLPPGRRPCVDDKSGMKTAALGTGGILLLLLGLWAAFKA